MWYWFFFLCRFIFFVYSPSLSLEAFTTLCLLFVAYSESQRSNDIQHTTSIIALYTYIKHSFFFFFCFFIQMDFFLSLNSPSLFFLLVLLCMFGFSRCCCALFNSFYFVLWAQIIFLLFVVVVLSVHYVCSELRCWLFLFIFLCTFAYTVHTKPTQAFLCYFFVFFVLPKQRHSLALSAQQEFILYSLLCVYSTM